MHHIMIDLETLGVNHTAIFVSVGACRFDPETGKTGKTFYGRIDWDSALKAGRSITPSTLKWWLGQSETARKEITKEGRPIKDVLREFAKWALEEESYVWGNGAAFDIAILENAYTHLFDAIPWKFWNVRDVRTIAHLAEGKVSKADFPFSGTVHNALDDAIHQAKYVSAMWQALKS